jgi:putative flippase GtrA
MVPLSAGLFYWWNREIIIFAQFMPKETITRFVDFFYPPFRRIMPLQTFRYAACGGANVVFGNVILFALLCQFFTNKYGPTMIVAGYIAKSYNIAFVISSTTTFVIGFLLNKYVVFVDSNIKGRIQLFRYFLAFLLSFVLNYIFLKIMVEYMHLKPIGSQRIATAIIISVSYMVQRHFTFRTKKVHEETAHVL